jgi:hypothetical protein
MEENVAVAQKIGIKSIHFNDKYFIKMPKIGALNIQYPIQTLNKQEIPQI